MNEQSRNADYFLEIDNHRIKGSVEEEIESGIREELRKDPEMAWNAFCAFRDTQAQNTLLIKKINSLNIWRIILVIILIVLGIWIYMDSDKLLEYEEAFASIQNEYFWYQNNAVIVGAAKPKRYHSYGCYKLDLSDGYWIYNVEAAEYKGIKPCKKCQ